MKLNNSRVMIAILATIALLMPAALVWASPPTTAPSIPLQATPGLDADKVDGHHAGPSSGTKAQRANRVLWAMANGKLSFKAMPVGALNARYLNDDRAETISTTVTGGAVLTITNTGTGVDVWGLYASGEDRGIFGQSSGYGVYGLSSSYVGVIGESSSGGRGVYGWSGSGTGVYGASTSGYGVYGWSNSGTGVYAASSFGNLIEAWDSSPSDRRFYVDNAGNVYADGNFNPGGADLAEMLPAVNGLEPGDVLSIGPDGRLTLSASPNSTSVAGVYSTKPGFLGGASDDDDPTGKVPLGIAGVVPVKASAENGPILPGDLLTSSSTPGHAMKASPVNIGGISLYLPGTILGKALEPLEEGSGVIKVLVSLQ